MSDECYHLLFVDDDQDFLNSMELAMSSKNLGEHEGIEFESHFINNPAEGLEFIEEVTEEKEKVAVIISDQQMPEMTGVEFLEQATKLTPYTIKMLLTGYASLDSAKYAINNNILDQYISKPIEDYDNFVVQINNSLKRFDLTMKNLRAEEEKLEYIRDLEISNKKIKSMHAAAEKIAYLAQGFKKLDLDEVFDLIINKLPQIFGAKYSSLFILNQDDNTLNLVKSNHLSEAFKKPMELQSAAPMMVALRENKVIVVSEVGETSSLEFLNKESLGNSCVIIPFYVGGKHVTGDILGNNVEMRGVLNLGNIDAIDSEDIVHYTAELIKNIMGINILNANLYKQTTHMALIDGLSGLYNKYIFSEFLRKACIYAERHSSSFYLAMFDIDDFKAINDTHGHLAGDDVLSQIGSIFQGFARKSDVIARFGGEEFAWILYGAATEDILKGLERVRCAIRDGKYPKGIKVTISIGLGQYLPDNEDAMEKLIERADKALYQAKANGKNRIEVNLEQ